MKQLTRKILLLLSIGLLVLIIGSAVQIGRFARIDQTPTSDAAIVLGAAAWKATPSPVFAERIKHALGLYRQGLVKKLIFTGGFGSGQQYAESQVARNYAIAHGIPANAILIETQSHTTLQNLQQAQRLLQSNALHSAILVSDPLHMYRAKTMAEDLGLQVASSPTPTSQYRSLTSRAKFLGRETYFFLHYLLTGF